MYAITFDQTNIFNLKFTASNIDNNIDSAMSGIGYSNMIPITSLVQINAVIFTTDSVSNYVSAGQLVIDEGIFATSPAQLKSIVAGTGMEVVSSTNEVTLNALATGTSYGTSLDTGSGPVVDLTWSTTKLIFSAEDFQATPDISQDTTFLSLKPPMHVGITGNAQDISVLHLEPTMFEFATANQVALLSLKQSYIDALIDAKIQAATATIKQQTLDCILADSNDFIIDRSVAGQITLSHDPSFGGGHGSSGPAWQMTPGVEYTFNGSQSAYQNFDVNQFNPVQGCILDDAAWDTGNGPYTLAFSWKKTGGGLYQNLFVRDATREHGCYTLIKFDSHMAIAVSNVTTGAGAFVNAATPPDSFDLYYGIPIALDTWMHVTLVWSGTDTAVYIDGQARSKTADSGFSFVNHSSSTEPLLGIYEDPGQNPTYFANPFVGKMKNMQLHHRVLTNAEITALAGGTSVITY